jgi:ATP-binding cassette, subfamily B, bacterial PglK
MLIHQSYRILIHRLWAHISVRRRWQFLMLLVLTMFSSFAEVVSLSAVLPFIAVITQPDKLFNFPLITDIAHKLGIEKGADLVIPLTILFIVASVLSAVIRIFLVWSSISIAKFTGADISLVVFRRTLYQPYSTHVARSSSEVLSGLTQKVGAAVGVISAVVLIITSGILFASIMTTLFIINPIVATISVVVFGSAYIFIAFLTRHRVEINGQRYAKEQSHLIKIIQEGLGGIRDIIIDGTQAVYCNTFHKSNLLLQRADRDNTFINGFPRYFMESMGMILIAILVLLTNYQSGNVVDVLPILGALALGAQRSLPLMQTIYGGWSSMLGSKAALVDVLELLDQPLQTQANLPEPEPLVLRETISFKNISFQYGINGPPVLEGFNLTISKGSRLGIIGKTGSGKSTVLDLLMALLEPTRGQIRVDEIPLNHERKRAWQKALAHVPQSIFLTDSTIAENIAFGTQYEKIDFERVREAAKQARISEFIESSPESYGTIVGERGVRLSGGQRQRIGIARALYKQASVLIFDEATSALDSETEQAVMQAIEGLSKELTLLIIAHRLTTLKNCTQIVELGNGGIMRIGSYQDIVNLTAVEPEK